MFMAYQADTVSREADYLAGLAHRNLLKGWPEDWASTADDI